jgi:hypothetical protein
MATTLCQFGQQITATIAQADLARLSSSSMPKEQPILLRHREINTLTS